MELNRIELHEFFDGGLAQLWSSPEAAQVGCPTFRGFRKVGTTGLHLMFIGHSQAPGFFATPDRPKRMRKFLHLAAAPEM